MAVDFKVINIKSKPIKGKDEIFTVRCETISLETFWTVLKLSLRIFDRELGRREKEQKTSSPLRWRFEEDACVHPLAPGGADGTL